MSTNKKSIKDPVCGMEVKPKEIEHRSQHEGSTYYFCSRECKGQFEGNPSKYSGKRTAA